MKSFVPFLLVCSVGALSCLSAVSYADINSSGQFKSLLFETSVADAPSATVSFDYQPFGDQSSLGTCAMNPMTQATTGAVIEELPLVQEIPPMRFDNVAQRVLNPQQPPTPTPPGNPPRDYPPPTTTTTPPEESSPPIVPEPATLLMLTVGLAGLMPLVRRRHKTEP